MFEEIDKRNERIYNWFVKKMEEVFDKAVKNQLLKYTFKIKKVSNGKIITSCKKK